MFVRILFFAALAAGVLYLLRTVMRGKHLFRATVRPNGVDVTGSVPTMNNSDAREFLAGLQLPIGAWVDGHKQGPGGFQLSFSDDFPEHRRQQVRNFLRTRIGGL